ncbi:MAG: hypothetical protein ACI39W_05260 [Brotaphodocola sp.]
MNEKYLEAVRTIKAAILRSQNTAVKYTNAEMLSLYCSIGGCVSGNSREGTWGTGAIDEWQPYFQTNVDALPDSESIISNMAWHL